ncbi:hypothetical protein F2P56_032055, partial [Juglans regia]
LWSLISHMTPLSASKTIERHGYNMELGVRFFKWVCKHSTSCYDLDSRIILLNSIISSNLYAIAHKAVIALGNVCSGSETEMLKLMGALDEMRKVGFRLSYPGYTTSLLC